MGEKNGRLILSPQKKSFASQRRRGKASKGRAWSSCWCFLLVKTCQVPSMVFSEWGEGSSVVDLLVFLVGFIVAFVSCSSVGLVMFSLTLLWLYGWLLV